MQLLTDYLQIFARYYCPKRNDPLHGQGSHRQVRRVHRGPGQGEVERGAGRSVAHRRGLEYATIVCRVLYSPCLARHTI